VTIPDRTRALAAQYSRIYGTEKDNDHMRPEKALGQIKVQCPQCEIQATVLENLVPALLERWRQEHERDDEPKEAG
jgi:hypothetical protein